MKSANHKYIELQSLKDDTFGDTSILKEIMVLFIDIIDEYTTVLDEELINKNWPVLFKATHKIKPNISMFGIKELEPLINLLDNNFRNEQNLEDVDHLAEKSFMILKEVKIEIQNELKLMNNE